MDIRRINNVIIIGSGGFRAFNPDLPGPAVSGVATAFPSFNAMVIEGTIHAQQVEMMIDYVQRAESGASGTDGQQAVFRDAVPLFIRDNRVMIRVDGNDVDLIMSADFMLQRLFPKSGITFNGRNLDAVRQRLRRQGEIWRLAAAPGSRREIIEFLENYRQALKSGILCYYSMMTGTRWLTWRNLEPIRGRLAAGDTASALAALKEILDLSARFNRFYFPEVAFFLPDGVSLDIKPLLQAVNLMGQGALSPLPDQPRKLIDDFTAEFRRLAEPIHGQGEDEFRRNLFCRLTGIETRQQEEYRLNLSPEFQLNIRWLPGAAILREEPFLRFEPECPVRVRNIIQALCADPAIQAVNIGRIMTPQTSRLRFEEERDVYLAVLGRRDHTETVHFLRKIKWDVRHRLAKGEGAVQAIDETCQYRDYIVNRLTAIRCLGVNIPAFSEIRITEVLDGFDVPAVEYFFIRDYFKGFVTDKIPAACYARESFVIRLLGLLGQSAADSLILGRSCARTGRLFFDDGDELVRLDADGIPEDMMLIETTGAFNDWTGPPLQRLPECIDRVEKHLILASRQNIPTASILAAREAFREGLITEIIRLKRLVSETQSDLKTLFSRLSDEPGGFRCRWESVLTRIERMELPWTGSDLRNHPET